MLRLIFTLTTSARVISMYSKDTTSVQTSGWRITQLANISVDPMFIELTANVFRRFFSNVGRQRSFFCTARQQDAAECR